MQLYQKQGIWKFWHMEKKEVADMFYFYPRWLKLSLFTVDLIKSCHYQIQYQVPFHYPAQSGNAVATRSWDIFLTNSVTEQKIKIKKKINKIGIARINLRLRWDTIRGRSKHHWLSLTCVSYRVTYRSIVCWRYLIYIWRIFPPLRLNWSETFI